MSSSENPDVSDEEIFFLFVEGDDSAFAEIYNRYWDKLFIAAANKVQDMYVAEELVQNIFTKIWLRRADIKLTHKLNTYLAVSLKYSIINWMAREKRESRYHQTLNTEASGSVYNDPFEALKLKELKINIDKLVSALPEKCQMTFKLSREMNLSQKEIAKLMNISEKGVERNLTRALNSLRLSLKKFIFF